MTPLLTGGELFAGIGGLGLALEAAGIEVRWQVEWDETCQLVLAKHWPNARRYADVTQIDTSALERVDVIAGGFPCQPISNAGKRLGTADERWLWPEFARVVRDLRPRYVLVENVSALLGRGMGLVVGDLAALGYDAEWDCLRAADVGAPHERDRIFIVAYARGDRPTPRGERPADSQGGPGRPPLGRGSDGDARPVAVRSAGQGAGDALAHADDAGRGEHARIFPLVAQFVAAQRGRAAALADADRAERWTSTEGRDDVADRDDARREEAAGGPRPRGQDRDAGVVADAEGERGELRSAEGERPGGSAGGGAVPVADAGSAGRGDGDAPRGHDGAIASGDDADGRDALADATRNARWPGLRAPGPRGIGWRRLGDGSGSDVQAPAEPGVGGGADGLRARVDGHWWPAPPGPQYAWEPPRTAPSVPGRVQRLKQLGNAVVPQLAACVARAIAADAALDEHPSGKVTSGEEVQ